jgi:hypothetical protein
MLLKAPSTIDEPVIEGTFATVGGADDVAFRGVHDREADVSIGRELPVVKIGRPESWRLVDLFHDGLPPLLEASHDHEFRLIRLACSFRPRQRGEGIEWARFSVQILPDDAGNQPVAFDLHPLEQVREVKRNLKVTLSPSLKFKEVEGSLGSLETGLQYDELQPTVSGSGIGETTPSWDFEATRGVDVIGTRVMHLITRAPRGMSAARAALEITADVVGAGFRIPVILRRERTEEDRLEVRLWEEARP